AHEDAKRRELRRVKNRLEGLIYANERVFEQLSEGMGEGDRKKINQSLLRARMALTEEEMADVEAAIFDLQSLSQKLSQIMLEQAKADKADDKKNKKDKKEAEKAESSS
ncbi:MAG: hypothetical protein AAGD38_12760, partial [Acidobacteriota bacterium]